MSEKHYANKFIDHMPWFAKKFIISLEERSRANSQLDTLINHNYKFIIYLTPKCGSGSVKTWFLQLAGVLPFDITAGDVDKSLEQSIHKYIVQNHKKYCAKKNNLYSEYKKAIIVRNPWQRIVSTYCDKIVRGHYLNFINSQKPIYDKVISFKEFVNIVKDVEDSYLEPHLRSQLFEREHIAFDFFLRIESLESDLLNMSNSLGIPNIYKNIITRNSTNYDHDFSQKVYDLKPYEFKKIPDYCYFYDSSLVSLVEEKYHSDISKFGYQFSN